MLGNWGRLLISPFCRKPCCCWRGRCHRRRWSVCKAANLFPRYGITPTNIEVGVVIIVLARASDRCRISCAVVLARMLGPASIVVCSSRASGCRVIVSRTRTLVIGRRLKCLLRAWLVYHAYAGVIMWMRIDPWIESSRAGGRVIGNRWRRSACSCREW